MDRKEFLKKTIVGTSVLVAGTAMAKVIENNIDELVPLKAELNDPNVGFNHIPNRKEENMNNHIFHPAESRGLAQHGWLTSRHTFSFANYYNPDRMHFGVLRVLNDDIITGGSGFGTHPHDNMEIISIPLKGALEHKDSMNNVAVIQKGEIQVMSAGTGITHSEYNKLSNEETHFLQIWVFPNKKNVTPRYDQLMLNEEDRKNKLQQILSPNAQDAGVWIHQNAWFHLGHFASNIEQTYALKSKENGVYAFVLSGKWNIDGQEMSARDGLGIIQTESFQLKALSEGEILLMEVPMAL